MPIDTNKFKKETQPSLTFLRPKGRGGNMVRLDSALEEYDRNKNGGNIPVIEGDLYFLIKACKVWLKEKAIKASKATKASSFSQKRFQAVLTLQRDAVAELCRISPRAGAALGRFNQRKTAYGNAPAMPTTALSPGYGPERTLYAADKRQAVFAAGAVHMRYERIEEMGRAERTAMDQQVRGKGFENLTDLEFQELGRLYARSGEGNGEVAYLNKIQRMRFMIEPDEDGLFEDINAVAVSMTNASTDLTKPGFSQDMYAMDKYGNMFCNDPVNKINGKEYFNHSSFNAGNDIICAGELHIGGTPARAGKLNHIDNASGHYKPNRDALHRCVTMLNNMHVNLADTRVSVFDGAGRQSYRALTFLANKNGLPDWPAAKSTELGIAP